MQTDIIKNTIPSQDLSAVSTKDLMNEVYKRGAIQHLKYNKVICDEFMGDPDYVDHVKHGIRHDALTSNILHMHNLGVFNYGKGTSTTANISYAVDFFVCKHPLTLINESI